MPSAFSGKVASARQKAYKQCIARARRYLDEDKLYRAYRSITAAARSADGNKMKQQVQALLGELETKVDALMRQADQQYSSANYAEAMKTYRSVSRMKKLKAAAAAKKKYAAGNKDPGVRNAVRQAMREVMATEKYERVEEMLEAVCAAGNLDLSVEAESSSDDTAIPSDNTDTPNADADLPGTRDIQHELDHVKMLKPTERAEVVTTLEALAKRYADTHAGYQAAQLLEHAQTDQELAAQLEHDRKDLAAKKRYDMAKLLSKSGRDAQARRIYRDIIRQWPETSWAQLAQAALEPAEDGQHDPGAQEDASSVHSGL